MEWIYSGSSRVRKYSATRFGPSYKGCFISFVVLVVSLCSHAQQLIWSEPTSNNRAIERVQAVAKNDSVVHVIEERENHELRWICYHWNNLNVLKTADIKMDDADMVLEHFFILNDTLQIISTRWNNKTDCTEVFAMRFGMDGKRLGESVWVHKRSETSRPRRSGVQCMLSPDSSLFLVYFDSDNERKQTEGIHFKCYRNNWEPVWEKELRLPPSIEIIQVHQFLLDNAGGVYLMSGREPIKTSSEWQRPQGGQYVVYYYNAAQNKLKQYDISLKDKQVISVKFMLDESSRVIIAGYYSEDFQNRVSGTLLFSIQAFGGPIIRAAYTPFDVAFLKEMSGEEKGTLDDYYLDHIRLTASGDIVLAGEQYFTSRYITNDPTTGRQVVEYRYNYHDVMVCMMDTAGVHKWNVCVPKRQFSSSMNDPNFSYGFAADATSIVLLFNDDPANNTSNDRRNGREPEVWAGNKNCVTTRVVIDYSGSASRKTVVENNTDRLLFNPLMHPATDWSMSLLGFNDKRTYKFCRVL
jgi:hypothetical protein